jgi:hypothetical protein
VKPLLLWKNSKCYIFGLCVCSLSYSPCKATHHIVFLSVACLALPYFSALSHKREKVTGLKICVLKFSTTPVSSISHSKSNSAKYYHKYAYVFTKCSRHSCQILMKLEPSQQIFEKLSNIKFHENLSSGRRVVPWGRTDRHDDANSRFSQFGECT